MMRFAFAACCLVLAACSAAQPGREKAPGAATKINELVPKDVIAAPPRIDQRTIRLFDGRTFEQWRTRDNQPAQWIVKDDRSVEVKGGAGDVITRDEFGDFQLHIEFMCPTSAGKQGQAKSNSGVYLHGRYELQVLDSPGQPPANNLCGGIYQIAAPLVNAAAPAGQWQSYDIVFRAPRFDDAGAVIENPRVTVVHNGAAIHDNIELPGTTPGGIDRKMAAKGPILLQDHGDPVRYRNIWIRRLD